MGRFGLSRRRVKGTICTHCHLLEAQFVYCSFEDAQYIPDGMTGPVCGGCWYSLCYDFAYMCVNRWRRHRFAVQKDGIFKYILDIVGIEIGLFVVNSFDSNE